MNKRTVKRVTITYINDKSYTIKNVKDLNITSNCLKFTKVSRKEVAEGITVYSEDFHIIQLKNVKSVLDESSAYRVRVYKVRDGEVDALHTEYL